MSARLDPGRIQSALRVGLRGLGIGPGQWPGAVSVLAVTESTNDEAFRLGRAGAPDGTAVFAEEQRAGRGRRDRRWSAPPGRNLTFSVVVRTSLNPDRWSRVAHASALAVARAVDPWLQPLRAEIKWPNDIYVDARKLGGILVEAQPRNPAPFLVVGIGLNVGSMPEEFAAEGLQRDVTSIAHLSGGREADRSELGGAVLAELWCQVRRCEDAFEDLLAEVQGRSCLFGKTVRVWMGNEIRQGEVLGLGPNGELLVREPGVATVRVIVSADQVREA